MIEPLSEECRVILKASKRRPWFRWIWFLLSLGPIAYPIARMRRVSLDDPALLLLLDSPDRIVAVHHIRQWFTDVFRVIADDGSELVMYGGGTMSWRLSRALAVHCASAQIDTPWVMRGHERRAVPPVPARAMGLAPAANGWPFA